MPPTDDGPIVRMSEESKKLLNKASKGRPVEFVMICKGVRIIALVLFRYGKPTKPFIEEARKIGRGDVYAGVIHGTGKSLVFSLDSNEYSSPPGRELILKDFLFLNTQERWMVSYDLSAGKFGDDSELDEERSKIAKFLKKHMVEFKDMIRDNYDKRKKEIQEHVKLLEAFVDDDSDDLDAAQDAVDELEEILEQKEDEDRKSKRKR